MSIENRQTVDESVNLAASQDRQPDKKTSRVRKNTPKRMPAGSDSSLTKELILRLVELIKQV